MGLYLKSGYVNARFIFKRKQPFVFVIGGRATGKTYGSLKELLEERKKFFLLRRTQTQAEILSDSGVQPFNIINRNEDYDKVTTKRINKYVTGFYYIDEDGNAEGEPIGYLGALSTFKNIRGIDMSDIQILLYDEFIPEKHEKRMTGEAEALWNAYETINRNRELNGEDPLKLIGLSNSNTIANAIFTDLKIVNKIVKMQEKKTEVLEIPDRNLCVINLCDSKISEKKKETALYKLVSDGDFKSMSLENNFADVPDNVKQIPLGELLPIVKIGGICLYSRKNSIELYATEHQSGAFTDTLTDSDRDVKAFRMKYPFILLSYFDRTLYFDSAENELRFRNILQL